jgi:hypothetical protein
VYHGHLARAWRGHLALASRGHLARDCFFFLFFFSFFFFFFFFQGRRKVKETREARGRDARDTRGQDALATNTMPQTPATPPPRAVTMPRRFPKETADADEFPQVVSAVALLPRRA